MQFQNITVEDKKIMDPFLLNNPYGICDYSFANIFIWRDTYHTQYALYKNFLVLCSQSEEHGIIYLMPLGDGDKTEVIQALIEDAKERSIPFQMGALTPHMVTELQPILPENFRIHNEGQNGDYLYLSESMITLAGKKLSAKRNHINKFMSTYGDAFEYVDIDDTMLSECRQMKKKWCAERDCSKEDTDYCAVSEALKNFNALELKGGAIRVNGEMVAFTLGQKNNDNTFNILVEKALSHIDGAYPMINREFATRACGAFELINREEDLGIEGLRKAKQSYRPHLFLEKAIGVLEND